MSSYTPGIYQLMACRPLPASCVYFALENANAIDTNLDRFCYMAVRFVAPIATP